jgi:undecaprenyl pyrophosphate synthase
MDESGDLGFNKDKSSKYFIVTILFSNNHRVIEKIVSSIHRSRRKKFLKTGKTLHAYHTEPETRIKLLKKLSEKDIKIMTIYVNKSKVHTHLQEEQNILYNFVTNILLDRIYTKKLIPVDEEINLIASRKDTNKFLNSNFKKYLEFQAGRNHKLKLNVLIKTPQNEKCLQAVDFVSWAIFRKHEFDDEYYYEIIKEKIVEENLLYK